MMASPPVNLDLSSAVIFRPREGELAIWSLSPRMKSNNQVMERDGPLGEPMGAPG